MTPLHAEALKAAKRYLDDIRGDVNPEQHVAEHLLAFAKEAVARRMIAEANERREDDAARKAEIQQARDQALGEAAQKLRYLAEKWRGLASSDVSHDMLDAAKQIDALKSTASGADK